MSVTVSHELRERYQQLLAEEPKLRIRNAAERLNSSEAELLALELGNTVTRLDADWAKFLEGLEPLGPVMALTRNDSCVIEKTGVYKNVSINGPMGVAVNDDIDIRYFMKAWTFGFAVDNPEAHPKTRRSLQFFDASGHAIHKIFLTKDSNVDAFNALVEKYRADEQVAPSNLPAPEPKKADRPDAEIDVDGFQETWRNLKDTHDFFPMLRDFEVGRKQALRLMDREHAYPVAPDAYRTILETARDTKTPIMAFVGNHGCLEIHTGEVHKVAPMHGYFNVLDPGFNLHLKEADVAECWVTRKPTTDGYVTAVEVFDAHNNMIVQFFGKRKPGIPELEAWREIVQKLK